MKKFQAIIEENETGERKTVSEDTRAALIVTLQTWSGMGWTVQEFPHWQ